MCKNSLQFGLKSKKGVSSVGQSISPTFWYKCDDAWSLEQMIPFSFTNKKLCRTLITSAHFMFSGLHCAPERLA